MNDIVIRTSGLGRDFNGRRAVDDLSLEIAAGTIFGFLGPNGAGKTTTIRLLLGLLEPTRGKAEVLGYDVKIHGDEIRTGCGALLESNGLYERLSAEDNLEYFGRIWRLSRTDRKVRNKELLEHFGLWDRRKEPVKDWSRGMRQKLALARALLHRPRIIFLDEPTAGLDPVAAASLREDLISLASREGVTIFMNTHNLAEAEKFCGQVGVIRAGKLMASGHPDMLRRKTGSPRAEIIGSGFGEDLLGIIRNEASVSRAELENGRLVIDLIEGADVSPLVSIVVARGGKIEEVRKGQTSLEDVFLTLMEEER